MLGDLEDSYQAVLFKGAKQDGIAGFKPSLHRIPSVGMVYFSPTIDHVGLFTQDVEGMALAAAALCVEWRGTGRARLPALGVPVGAYLQQADSEMLTRFEETLTRLQGAGAQIKRVPLFAEIESLNQLHRRLVFAEFARGHARLFTRFADSYRPRTREIIELGRAVSDAELESLRTNVLALRAEIAAAMEAFGLDGWVCPPAVGAAPLGLHATGDPNLNLPWTHAGMPALTIPAGRAANGLPLGLQLVARFGEDEALLGWGIAAQEALRALQGA